MTIKFISYSGDVDGLGANDNRHVFRWNNFDCKILFAVSKKGKTASCHFSSDKAGLRHLKKAVNEFVEFCYLMFPWCEMILAITKLDSVGRLITKCGFSRIAYNKEYKIYLRV